MNVLWLVFFYHCFQTKSSNMDGLSVSDQMLPQAMLPNLKFEGIKKNKIRIQERWQRLVAKLKT